MQQTFIVEIYKNSPWIIKHDFVSVFWTLTTSNLGFLEHRHSWNRRSQVMNDRMYITGGWMKDITRCSWLNSRREGHLLKQDMLLYCRYRHIAVFKSRLYDIISYHIFSYHIISYHIISYHIIMSYHIISNHIMQCQIVCFTYVHSTFAFLQPSSPPIFFVMEAFASPF